MAPTAPSFRILLFAFCLFILDFCCAYPTPYLYTSPVFPRQENRLTSPETVTRTQKITTDVGTFIQTCNITLTPTVVDGVDMVREEETCSLAPDNGNDDVPGALPPGLSSTVSTQLPSPTSTSSPTLTSTSDTLSSTPNVVPSSTTDPSSTGVSTSTISPFPTVTGLPPGGSPVISITLTSVPRPSLSSSVSLPLSSSSVIVPTSGVPAVVIGISSVPRPTATPQPDTTDSSIDTPPPSSLPLQLSSPSLSSTPSPTPTAQNAGAAASFDPPGKKLEVLPIGLGVFAGVSVVALLAVGIVTYERTKHRRNFRKLRLEEGNRMRYGTA